MKRSDRWAAHAAPSAVHINPDNFLDTPAGRVTTPERNAWAWRQCFAALPAALAAVRRGGVVYVLVGPQGAGKTTWARDRLRQETEAVIFDAILVQRSERAPILALARAHEVPAVAVWFQAALETCLARNAARPPDEIADAQGLRNVFAAVEPPSVAEGFASVIVIEDNGAA